MSRPRVLVLTTYYHPVLGGAETHARRLVSHLHRTGFDVQVVTKRVSREHAAEAIVDDVRVHRVGPIGERRGSGKWLALPRFFAKALQLKPTFDVIVCIDFRGIGIAALAAGGILRRAVILQAETGGVLAGANHGSSSGLPPESGIVRALKSAPRAIYRRANHMVCIGHDIEREALDTGVPRERVHYLPHGVDLGRFHPAAPGKRDVLRTRLGWPTARPIVLFVGRLSIEKGVLDLVEAWRLVESRDALLVLVGPDMPAHPWDAGQKARALVAQHGLAHRVRFEGPATDTAPLYRTADLFVQPSHFEAFGLSAIEAMASGVPVVASNVGGLRDFLVDNENALLHEPRSPASIAAALTRALSDSSLRARLAEAALKTVTAQFDERVLMDRYAQLIERAARTD